MTCVIKHVLILLYFTVVATTDSRFKMFMHVGHGGGSFVCTLAQMNGEATFKSRNCNLPGDGAGKEYIVANCTERAAALKVVRKKCHKTFGACEHGFKDSEFCPHLYQYIFYFRDPMAILNSWLSSRVASPKAVSHLIHLMAKDPGTNAFNVKDIYESPEHSLYRLDNFVVRYFSGSNATCYGALRSINETHLQHAKETLQQFKVVFSDEDVKLRPQRVQYMLKLQLGWKKPLHVVNAALNTHGAHKLNVSQIAFFREYNKYGMMLYDYVKLMFRAASAEQ